MVNKDEYISQKQAKTVYSIYSINSSQVNDDHRKQAWKPLFPAITKYFINNITINNFYHTET